MAGADPTRCRRGAGQGSLFGLHPAMRSMRFDSRPTKRNIVPPTEQIRIERTTAVAADEILALQKIAYLSEAEIIDDYSIPPLHQALEDLLFEFERQIFLKATAENTVIGSVRCRLEEGSCYIGKLIVHPDHQNRGLGKKLLKAAEDQFPEAERYELFTGQRSKKNLHIYASCGYRSFKTRAVSEKLTLVYLEKVRPNMGLTKETP
jgi:GNAT superfamily N-acetyltransferase